MRHDSSAHAITPAPGPPQAEPACASMTLPRAEPDLARPTHVRYQVLAVASSLAVLTYILRQSFVGGAPYIKEALGLNDEEVGYLAAVWLVAYGAFQVPGGLLGDWFGGRHLLSLLVLGWSLLTAAVALTVLLPSGGWQPFAFLLLLRFLFGALQAGGFPALARVLADWMPLRQRGFAQGLVWTFSRLGGALAPLLYLWLFRAGGGWAPPFWLVACLGLLWCAGFWPWFRNRPGEMKQVNDAERKLIESSRPPARTRDAPLPWSCFLRSRNVWALCLMYGFVGFAVDHEDVAVVGAQRSDPPVGVEVEHRPVGRGPGTGPIGRDQQRQVEKARRFLLCFSAAAGGSQKANARKLNQLANLRDK
jgi:sugar phosphate permease